VPVLANLYGTRARVARALGIDPAVLVTEWASRLERSVPAILETDDVRTAGLRAVTPDLSTLPVPTLNEEDGGPFITAAAVSTRDPETGARNTGIYRLQVHGPTRLGILAAPHRDAGRAIVNAAMRGEDLPVSIAIGVAPALFLAACSPLPYGSWEADVAGALGGEPIRMLHVSDSVPEVPPAEIVLEGIVRTRTLAEEGPFGEFTGYYGPAGQRPVIDVTAMHLREDPILHVAYIGYPITETQVLQTATSDPTAYAQLRHTVAGLVAVHLPPTSGGQPIMYLSIRKRSQGEAGSAILAAMASKSRPKYVVVVDEDVDVTNEALVLWAIATRSNPERSLYHVPDSIGMSLDPTSTHLRTRYGTSVITHKLGIDATIPLDRADFPHVIRPDPDHVALVNQRWREYGPQPVSGQGAAAWS
jgi:2,5-furandicarboxylate decarboxylase 1